MHTFDKRYISGCLTPDIIHIAACTHPLFETVRVTLAKFFIKLQYESGFSRDSPINLTRPFIMLFSKMN